jgi:hypothetical protein
MGHCVQAVFSRHDPSFLLGMNAPCPHTLPLIRDSVSAHSIPTPESPIPPRDNGPSEHPAGVTALCPDGLSANGHSVVGKGGDQARDQQCPIIANSASAHAKGIPCRHHQADFGADMVAEMDEESRALFHKRFPDAKFFPDTDCDIDHHIWSDLDLQLNHFRCWPEYKQELLRYAYNKVNYDLADGSPGYWKRQKLWKDYDSTASIVALSSYENQHDFLRCGFHGYSCSDRLLCLRCTYNLMAKPALVEFSNAFHADNEVYFVVTSLSREPDERKRLIFKDLTKSEMQQIKLQGQFEQGKLNNSGVPFEAPHQVLDAQIYWDIFAQAIHAFTGRGKPFSGAFGGPELSVRFMPLAVLPHANYITWSPGLSADDVRELRRVIREKLRGCRRLTSKLRPKVAVYRIQSRTDLRHVIKYIFKPIALAYVYSLTAQNLDYRSADMMQLNDQVNVFLESMVLAFSGVNRMNRYGTCSPSSGSKNYIGFVSPQRQRRRKQDAKRRRLKRAEAQRIRKMFPEYHPHRRRQSKRDKWDTFVMRAFYRQAVVNGEVPRKKPKCWMRGNAKKPARR